VCGVVLMVIKAKFVYRAIQGFSAMRGKETRAFAAVLSILLINSTTRFAFERFFIIESEGWNERIDEKVVSRELSSIFFHSFLGWSREKFIFCLKIK
jgi:hypothetical protein